MNKIAKKARPVIALLIAILMVITLSPSGLNIAKAASDGNNDTVTASSFTGESTKVADTSTAQSWQDMISSTSAGTKYLGRIWTDKSVYSQNVAVQGGSGGLGTVALDAGEDFLVELSALSSMSNLTTYTSQTAATDIVLVLDTSGSMDDDMSGEPTRITENTRLYAMQQAANDFIDLTLTVNKNSDEDHQNRISIVSYATRASVREDFTIVNDTTATTLKNTINGLSALGATDTASGMKLASEQIDNARSSAQKVVIVLTDGVPVANGDEDDKDDRNETAGTAVDYAKTIKDGGGYVWSVGIYSGADYTDTDVSTTNGFMNALSSNYPNAYMTTEERSFLWITWTEITGFAMGDGGSYTNGYFKTAGTADELNNVFMEIFEAAVAKSYSPTYTEDGEEAHESGFVTFTDTLGAYMEVKNMKSVVYANTIYTFNGTSTTSGNTTTYTYQSQAVGGDTAYINDGNLNQLQISVQKGTDSATGDIITVKIPSSILPLAKIEVTQTAGTDQYSYAETNTWPIRVFYSVGVKAASDATKYANLIEELIDTGDAGMKDYVAENSTDGCVHFYSNAYDIVTMADYGTTTSSFAPAKGNSFYYFQEDTPLYSDENCTMPLKTAPADDGIYFYKHTYWDETADGSGIAEQKTEYIRVYGSYLLNSEEKTGMDSSGCYYITAGSPRLGFLDGMHTDKGDSANKTETAKCVLAPSFDTKVTPLSVVTNYLGNNGRLSYDLTAELKITKQTAAATGHTIPESRTDDSFTIVVDMTDEDNNTSSNSDPYEGNNATGGDTNGNSAGGGSVDLADESYSTLSGSYPYQIYNADGTKKSSGDITSGGSVKLADGEYVIISGIPEGTLYTISETDLDDNWKNTNEAGELSGTLQAGEQMEVVVENEYSALPVTTGDDTAAANFLKLFKDFMPDSSWSSVPDATFEFRLESVSTTAAGLDASTMPMPGTTTPTTSGGRQYLAKTVTMNDYIADFGDIEFDRPGTYYYRMYEQQPESGSAIPGVYYSGERYDAVIEVADTDADGQLEIVPTPSDRSEYHSYISKTIDRTGIPISDPIRMINLQAPVSIYNDYDEDTATVRLEGTKTLDDPSGAAGALFAGEFTFSIDVPTATEYAQITDSNKAPLESIPSPVDESGSVLQAATNEADGDIGLGLLTFNSNEGDFEDVTTTTTFNYYYIVRENDVNSTYKVTKDKGLYRVKVSVTKTVDEGDVSMSATVSYENSRDNGVSWRSASDIAFVNTFSPDNASASYNVKKTLSGRVGLKDESFLFDIYLASAKTPDGADIVDGVKTASGTTFNAGDYVETLPMNFNYKATTDVVSSSSLTYTKVGTYTFSVRERSGDMPGMTYDSHFANVTVTVTGNINQESLMAETTVSNDGAPSASDAADTDNAAFTNYYDVTLTDENITLQLTKHMSGATAEIGKFTFRVEGAECPSGTGMETATAAEATAHLKDGTAYEISNPSVIPDGETYTMTLDKILSFTQDDLKDTGAQKMFAYTLYEVIPDDATYDLNGTTITYGTATDEQKAAVAADLDGGWTLDGITYDSAAHAFYVILSWDSDDGLEMEVQSTEAGQSGDIKNLALFANSYAYSPVTLDLDDDTGLGIALYKTLNSISWSDTQTFSFQMKASEYVGDAGYTPETMPQPEKETIAVDNSNPVYSGIDATAVKISLGSMTFEQPGTYIYKLQEIGTDGTPASGTGENGISYDVATGTLTVVVTDNGKGQLVATPTLTGLVENAFVNTYTTTLDLGSRLNIDIVNTLTGKDAAEGDFKFTVEAVADSTAGIDEETQKKLIAQVLGLNTDTDAYSMGAAADGVSTSVPVLDTNGTGITLTGLSVGRTYSFKVSETTVPTGSGYTNSDKDKVSQVDIAITTDPDDPGVMLATIFVDGVQTSVLRSDSDNLTDIDLAYASTYEEYTITSTAGEGGTITPLGDTIVPDGGSQTYTISADEGYTISDVLVDGISIGAVSSYEFPDISAKHTIEARFEEDETPTTEPTTEPTTDPTDEPTTESTTPSESTDKGGGSGGGSGSNSGGSSGGSSSNSGKNGSSAKTGDESPITLYIALAALSVTFAAGTAVCLKRRRK